MNSNKQILTTLLTAFEYDKDPSTFYYYQQIARRINDINSTPIVDLINCDDFRMIFDLGMGVEFVIDPYSDRLYDQVEMWTRDDRFRKNLIKNLDYLIEGKIRKRYKKSLVGFKMWMVKWRFDKYSCIDDVLVVMCEIMTTIMIIGTVFLVVSLLLEYLVKPLINLFF
jgi:hypothetical protein